MSDTHIPTEAPGGGARMNTVIPFRPLSALRDKQVQCERRSTADSIIQFAYFIKAVAPEPGRHRDDVLRSIRDDIDRMFPPALDHSVIQKIRQLGRVRPRALKIIESVVDRLLRDDDDEKGGA